MRQTLFLTVLAAALLGSGVANAAGTLKASEYTGGSITLGSGKTYDTLAVNVPLTLIGGNSVLNLNNGATIEFQKKQAADEICSIFTTEQLSKATIPPVSFLGFSSVYNFTFDDGAQAIVAASAGKTITLIHDITKDSPGFSGVGIPMSTLTLNGKGYNETVEMGGVSFTYVGPQEDTYTFKAGEIGFTGYYAGSHALNLMVGPSPAPVPEPTTGTLSLLALVALAARRRKHYHTPPRRMRSPHP